MLRNISNCWLLVSALVVISYQVAIASDVTIACHWLKTEELENMEHAVQQLYLMVLKRLAFQSQGMAVLSNSVCIFKPLWLRAIPCLVC